MQQLVNASTQTRLQLILDRVIAGLIVIAIYTIVQRYLP